MKTLTSGCSAACHPPCILSHSGTHRRWECWCRWRRGDSCGDPACIPLHQGRWGRTRSHLALRHPSAPAPSPEEDCVIQSKAPEQRLSAPRGDVVFVKSQTILSADSSMKTCQCPFKKLNIKSICCYEFDSDGKMKLHLTGWWNNWSAM